MNANARPVDVEPEPILCYYCLAEKRAQRTWRNDVEAVLVCPVHGPVVALRAS